MLDKKTARKEMKATLSALEDDVFQAKSLASCEQAAKHPAFIEANTILCYMAMKNEANTDALIATAQKMGKRIAFPYCAENYQMLALLTGTGEEDWEVGAYGIRTPILERATVLAPEEIDLIVVPGLGFDAEGRRLGRGAGYYDRFLEKTNAFRLGFCLDVQLMEEVPVDEHDKKMNAVVAGNQTFEIK